MFVFFLILPSLQHLMHPATRTQLLFASEFVENNVCFFHILHEMRCLYSERLDEPVKN